MGDTYLDLERGQWGRAVRARDVTATLLVHVCSGVLGETQLTEVVAAALLRGLVVLAGVCI